MKSYRTPKVVLKRSRTHGTGTFAIERIARDELVGIRSGDVVSFEEAGRRDREIGGFSMQVEAGFSLCPSEDDALEDIAMFFNHSCDPNVGIRGQISFVAMRDIAIGEELTIDYAMNVSYPYELECRCGTARCRGVVTGDDWQDPALQERYRGYFDAVITEQLARTEGTKASKRLTQRDLVSTHAVSGPVADLIHEGLASFVPYQQRREGRLSARAFSDAVIASREGIVARSRLTENEVSLSVRCPPRVDSFIRSAHDVMAQALGLEPFDEVLFKELLAARETIDPAFAHGGYKTYIFPEEAALAFALARKSGARSVISLGSYYGYWSAWAARGLAAGSRMTLVDCDAEACELAEENARMLDLPIEIVCEEATRFLKTTRETYDLALLDAEGDLDEPDPRRSRKRVYGPIVQALLPRTAPGALLLAHNVLLEHPHPDPYFERLLSANRADLHEFHHWLAAACGAHVRLPTTEGVGVYRLR